MDDDVGLDRLVTVVAQRDLVVADHRILVDAAVNGGAEIRLVAWQQHLAGLDAAADHGAPLQHQHAVARPREIRRAHQAVMPRARDYVIETLARPCLGACGRDKESRCQRRSRFYKVSPAYRHRSSIW